MRVARFCFSAVARSQLPAQPMRNSKIETNTDKTAAEAELVERPNRQEAEERVVQQEWPKRLHISMHHAV